MSNLNLLLIVCNLQLAYINQEDRARPRIFGSKLMNLDQSKAGHILYTVAKVNHRIVRGAQFAKIVLSLIYDLP